MTEETHELYTLEQMQDLLLCEDSWKVFPRIPPESIDLIATDPPYMEMKSRATADNKHLTIDGVWEKEDFYKFAMYAFNILKPGRHIYMFTQEESFGITRDSLKAAGFRLTSALVWMKRHATKGNYATTMARQTEFIIHGYKPAPEGEQPFSLNRYHNNILGMDECPSVPVERQIHPTGKSVSVMEFLVSQSSNSGDLVFDPFMGTGPTCIASVNLGRHYFGVDFVPEFYKKAEYLLRK